MEEVSSPIEKFSRPRRAVGLDRAFILSALARDRSSTARLITVILIAHFLTTYLMFSFLKVASYVPHVAHTRFWQALAGSQLVWI